MFLLWIWQQFAWWIESENRDRENNYANSIFWDKNNKGMNRSTIRTARKRTDAKVIAKSENWLDTCEWEEWVNN